MREERSHAKWGRVSAMHRGEGLGQNCKKGNLNRHLWLRNVVDIKVSTILEKSHEWKAEKIRQKYSEIIYDYTLLMQIIESDESLSAMTGLDFTR